MFITSVNTDNGSQRKFLLIVDSDKSRSACIKALLKQFRYKVWSVNTAAEALELSDIVLPSLVIALKFEDMPHVDFIAKLKQLDSSRKVPVLVVSSAKETIDGEACLSAGAFACMKLPLSTETMYRTIQVAIEPLPRMNLRINTTLPVLITDKALGNNGKFATTLSENGLFLMTANPCPLKTKVPLTFKLAGKMVTADAVVIYAHRQDNQTNSKPGMGLQFVRISDQDQEQIRLFIREEIKKGISVSGLSRRNTSH